MKITFAHQPADSNPLPPPGQLHRIRQPGNRAGMTISILFGLLMMSIPVSISIASSLFFPRDVPQSAGDENIPLWAVPIIIIFCIILHEFLHLICHPGFGLSDRSILIVWPAKLQFGVHYAGFMPKERWMLTRLLPLVCLTVLPSITLLPFSTMHRNFYLESMLAIIFLTNSLGSGADLAASIIVGLQVPGGSKIGIWGDRACWIAR